MKTPKTGLPERIERLLQEQRELEQELQQLKKQKALANIGNLVDQTTIVQDVQIVASVVPNTEREGLRRLVDELKNRLESGIVALASVTGDSAAFVVGVTPDIVKNRGLHAGKIISELTQLADGRGGGHPELAQGGSKNTSKVNAAIAAAPEIVKKHVEI